MAENTVFVVDDEPDVRESLAAVLASVGLRAETFATARDFLHSRKPDWRGCVLVDIVMPGMDGLALQEELNRLHCNLPLIIITGHGDIPRAVRAMKAGAVDFIEKPLDPDLLVASIRRAFKEAGEARHQTQAAEAIAARLAHLTGREREVLGLVVAGRANKEIARELGISPRTVEIHRAHVMEKMEVASLAELVRLTMSAPIGGPSAPLH
jgi:two-component system response regulator FixJ